MLTLMDTVKNLLDKLATGALPTLGETITLLEADEEQAALIYDLAVAITYRHHGNAVYLRGLIEFSNYCANRCHYCGIRSLNKNVSRYRMTPEEILAIACKIRDSHCGTVVLQSGVDPYYNTERVVELVRAIKQQTGLAITLSIGTKPYDELVLLKEAGADRSLLRFETSDAKVFETIHPDESFETRIECLMNLRKLGYQVGSGFMIGLPGTSTESIARDLLFARALELDMIGCGPFVPGEDTPMAGANSITDHSICYKTMALLRILNPMAHIPAATAFDAFEKGGRDKVILCGANVFMPNFTPPQYRENYNLYSGKPQVDASADIYETVKKRIATLGRSVTAAHGHSLLESEEVLKF